jgi:hypothetical protein
MAQRSTSNSFALNARRRSISAKSAQSVRSSHSKIVDTSVLGAQSYKKVNLLS